MTTQIPLVGLVLLASCATTGSTPPAATPISVKDARAKLEKLSPNAVQLWVVVHVRAHKTLKADGTVDEERLLRGALADADAVVHGHGDVIVLINSRTEMPLYEKIIAAVRERHPDYPLGISALAYGPSNLTEGFRLAKAYNAQIVWTEVVPDEPFEYEDDDGTYKEAETTQRDFALEVQRTVKPEAMHVSGVHMKYTRPLNGKTFPEAVSAALGTVDGINITGPKTAILADIARIEEGHRAAEGYPLGVASGVSTANIAAVVKFIDYAIVGTSLKEDHDPLRTSREKVWELRQLLDRLGGGPRR